MKLTSGIFIHLHRHQKATMTFLLKAELWARAHWMHRKKVVIFPEGSLAPQLMDPEQNLCVHLTSLTFNHL